MSKALIHSFWEAMGSNDFAHASRWLAPSFEYFMPQTGEYLQGPAAFAALNTAYPAEGRWQFAVRSVVSAGAEAVSDVVVTDGTMEARALTFHTVQDGLICKQIEYWPDPYDAPEWRKPWVEIRQDYVF